MEIIKNRFFVVSLGDTKIIESNREDAIRTLMKLVNESKVDVAELKREIVEVDTSGEKWSLKGLAWDEIALELMRKTNDASNILSSHVSKGDDVEK